MKRDIHTGPWTATWVAFGCSFFHKIMAEMEIRETRHIWGPMEHDFSLSFICAKLWDDMERDHGYEAPDSDYSTIHSVHCVTSLLQDKCIILFTGELASCLVLCLKNTIPVSYTHLTLPTKRIV